MGEAILVRHGQSLYNLKLTKDLDSELSEEGVRQVSVTARHLRENFDLSGYSGRVSPYHRCLQTARIIQQETGVPFLVEPGPREIMVSYEKCSIPLRVDLFPEFDWCPEAQSPGWTFLKETEGEFSIRLAEYHERLSSLSKVLVVSHGTPITALTEMRTRRYTAPSTTKYVDNSSISYLRDDELIHFNKVVYA